MPSLPFRNVLLLVALSVVAALGAAPAATVPAFEPAPGRPALGGSSSALRHRAPGFEFDAPLSWRREIRSENAANLAVFSLPPDPETDRPARLIITRLYPGVVRDPGGHLSNAFAGFLVDPGEPLRAYEGTASGRTLFEVFGRGTLDRGVVVQGPEPGSALHVFLLEAPDGGWLQFEARGARRAVEAAEAGIMTLLRSIDFESRAFPQPTVTPSFPAPTPRPATTPVVTAPRSTATESNLARAASDMATRPTPTPTPTPTPRPTPRPTPVPSPRPTAAPYTPSDGLSAAAQQRTTIPRETVRDLPNAIVGSGDKVGFVDIEIVIEDSRAIRSALEAMDTEMAELAREIDRTQGEMDRRQYDLDRQERVLSASERAQRREELLALQDERNRLQFQLEDKLRASERQIEPVLEEIMNVVADIAQREGYGLVLRGEVVIYGGPQADLTAKVTAELDRRAARIRDLFGAPAQATPGPSERPLPSTPNVPMIP